MRFLVFIERIQNGRIVRDQLPIETMDWVEGCREEKLAAARQQFNLGITERAHLEPIYATQTRRIENRIKRATAKGQTLSFGQAWAADCERQRERERLKGEKILARRGKC